MKIIIIASVAHNRVIGRTGIIPWNLPEDLLHFKTTTMGHTLLMGSKTFHSIGKPLSGRTNIVLTHDNEPQFKDYNQLVCVQNFDDAIQYCKENNAEKLFICGGGQVYKDAMMYANEMLITEVDLKVDGDTFFPKINMDKWNTVDLGYIGKHKLTQYIRSSPGNLVS